MATPNSIPTFIRYERVDDQGVCWVAVDKIAFIESARGGSVIVLTTGTGLNTFTPIQTLMDRINGVQP
jgi:hypothetical protein